LFWGRFYRKIAPDGTVVLPRNLHPGKVIPEEGRLLVIPTIRGREIVLSQDKLAYAQIEKEVVLVGRGFYYEVWNPKNLTYAEGLRKERRWRK